MEAYVTLVATDAYAAGALVLSHRIRDLGSQKPIVCLVTPNVSTSVRNHLEQVCHVVLVDTIRSNDTNNLQILGRPELDITYSKLHVWRLTQFDKVVFLDADTLPLRNVDELFDRESFSAAPDAGWPDCFNSGVFVATPSQDTFSDLIQLAATEGSFDGGDQGLLNTYFSDWSTGSPSRRLPFTFNATPTMQYSYAPAHYRFGHTIAIAHFIGQDKPWKWQRFVDGKVMPRGHAWPGLCDLVQSWWDTWNLHYGQVQPHTQLALPVTHCLDITYHNQPIGVFEKVRRNAWDTPRIEQDISVAGEHRHESSPMPPLSSVTTRVPSWLDEHLAMQEHTTVDETAQTVQSDTRLETLPSLVEDVSSVGSVAATAEDTTVDDTSQSYAYTMIHWDPAREPPPETRGVTSMLPDMSFTNAWDRPLDDQPVWIPPCLPAPSLEHVPHVATPSIPMPWEMHTSMYRPSRIWLDEYVQPPFSTPEDIGVFEHDKGVASESVTETIPHHEYQLDLQGTDSQSKEIPDHSGQYAMDAVMQTVSPRRSPFLSFLEDTHVDDNDWSERDMIPIPLKPTSKLSTQGLGMTPLGSPHSSRQSNASHSRRSSFSGKIQRSLPGYVPPENTSSQLPRLFAHEQTTYSKKTPYTSAAATPILDKDNYFEEDAFSVDDMEGATAVEDGRDFMAHMDYSIDRPLTELRKGQAHITRQERGMRVWDTHQALEELKQRSESMLSDKHLLDMRLAPSQVDQDIPVTEPLTSLPDKVPQSVPSEQHEATSELQQASLSMTNPMTAMATVLEAELDLSQSRLAQRRAASSAKENDSSSLVSYAPMEDTSVFAIAQQRLNELLTSSTDTSSPSLFSSVTPLQNRSVEDEARVIKETASDLEALHIQWSSPEPAMDRDAENPKQASSTYTHQDTTVVNENEIKVDLNEPSPTIDQAEETRSDHSGDDAGDSMSSSHDIMEDEYESDISLDYSDASPSYIELEEEEEDDGEGQAPEYIELLEEDQEEEVEEEEEEEIDCIHHIEDENDDDEQGRIHAWYASVDEMQEHELHTHQNVTGVFSQVDQEQDIDETEEVTVVRVTSLPEVASIVVTEEEEDEVDESAEVETETETEETEVVVGRQAWREEDEEGEHVVLQLDLTTGPAETWKEITDKRATECRSQTRKEQTMTDLQATTTRGQESTCTWSETTQTQEDESSTTWTTTFTTMTTTMTTTTSLVTATEADLVSSSVISVTTDTAPPPDPTA